MGKRESGKMGNEGKGDLQRGVQRRDTIVEGGGVYLRSVYVFLYRMVGGWVAWNGEGRRGKLVK